MLQGCDASVLLLNAKNNGPLEIHSDSNIGLRGFEVIDEAKRRLELCCPNVVSCSDILAFAARDASQALNGVNFDMPAGRLDSKFSFRSEADKDLPPPEFNLDQLKDIFIKKKNLTLEDLVVLSGAHTFGRSHCSSIKDRLYPDIAPTLNKTYGDELRCKCPQNSGPVNGVVNLDKETPFDLDSQYYRNLRTKNVLFFSDWALMTSDETVELVDEYADKPGDWEKDFTDSLVSLSKLSVITDPKKGEIRRSCRSVNY